MKLPREEIWHSTMEQNDSTIKLLLYLMINSCIVIGQFGMFYKI